MTSKKSHADWSWAKSEQKYGFWTFSWISDFTWQFQVSFSYEYTFLRYKAKHKCFPGHQKSGPNRALENQPPSKKAILNNCNDLFHPRQKDPTSKQSRNILAVAVAECVRVCMDRHYYTFGGNICKQKEGGSIGSALTGEISRSVMS